MKLQSLLFFGLMSILLSFSFSQCSSAQKTVRIANTIEIKNQPNPKAYFQHWVAGVRGGGSGTNVFIHRALLDNRIVDSIYFQNKIVKLVAPTNQTEFYTATVKRHVNELTVPVIGSSNENEQTNTIVKFPFILEDNEAVISYNITGKMEYIKLTNLIEVPGLAYPSIKPNNIN